VGAAKSDIAAMLGNGKGGDGGDGGGKGFFDLVVIDEAAQALEAECW
jgi:hypothetical protein